MKKVLFATSALVLSAGFAVAEVAVSGDGRMGMVYDGDDVQFSSRARVVFTLTGETDSGLSFGGKFRADQANDSKNGVAGAVWISGTYGKLSMGDVVSASEAAIGDLYEIGYTEGAFAFDLEEITYLTGDNAKDNGQGPQILYEYSIDNISFFASASDGSPTDWETTTGDNRNDDTAYSLAVKYDAGNWNAGLGYAKQGDAKEIGLGVEGQFDQFAVKGIYMHYKDYTNGIIEQDYTLGVSAAYTADALTVKGYVRQDKFDYLGSSDTLKLRAVGIGADYDLGGGATLAGAVANVRVTDAGVKDSETFADLGIKFKF